ncbi:MAG: hypothetical protein ABIG44_18550 [Planctomycetota bacterium]
MILSEADTYQNGLIFLVAILGLTFISLMLTRRARRRSLASNQQSRQNYEHLRQQSHVHSTMNELLLQLEDISRRINAQLDTKFVKLETVVRDADARIARLEKLTSQAPDLTTAVSPRADTATDSSANPPTQRIYELADAGQSPTQIAEAVALPLGEVELVLNLRGFC